MRGLLLKDWYTLVKQLRIMLLILVVFACIPNLSLASFAVFYAAMLPVTAMAYDERSKWNDLASMMPYSPMQIVSSKYVLGLLCVGASSAIALIAQFVVATVQGKTFPAESAMELLLVGCLALILLAINLPVMFRMGVEKGRILFLILTCAGVVAGMAFSKELISALSKLNNAVLSFVELVLITAIIFLLSVSIAAKMYAKRQGQ